MIPEWSSVPIEDFELNSEVFQLLYVAKKLHGSWFVQVRFFFEFSSKIISNLIRIKNTRQKTQTEPNQELKVSENVRIRFENFMLREPWTILSPFGLYFHVQK